jgi:hypothetical protein
MVKDGEIRCQCNHTPKTILTIGGESGANGARTIKNRFQARQFIQRDNQAQGRVLSRRGQEIGTATDQRRCATKIKSGAIGRGRNGRGGGGSNNVGSGKKRGRWLWSIGWRLRRTGGW